jgi:hypothetical protein
MKSSLLPIVWTIAVVSGQAIFLSALEKMTFDDARKILSGGRDGGDGVFQAHELARADHGFFAHCASVDGERGCGEEVRKYDAERAKHLCPVREFRSRQVRRRQDARRPLLCTWPRRTKDPQQSSSANHKLAETGLRAQSRRRFSPLKVRTRYLSPGIGCPTSTLMSGTVGVGRCAV